MNRREFLNTTTAAGLGTRAAAEQNAPVRARDPLKITRLETFLVRPRWLFLKIHTSAGIVGLGEPLVEGRAETCAAAVREVEPYLVGKDPRQVVHHWQAIYRHAFYRGGPVLTSVLSGIDMALWDIKGKALGVPVYELLGGPTRRRVRVYAHARTPADLRKGLQAGFTAFKTGPFFRRNPRYLETPAQVLFAAERFAELRRVAGNDVDIAIDFHGKISPALAKILIRALEPHNPMFVEEPVNCQNHDVMAEIARGTHLPIATGERVFTKWGFREVLEKRAATILQPDLCHAGGITEVRLIAGMAEAYYATIAPHNPLGPISLAAGIQLAAAIPNFLCQEQVSLGEGYLRQPFVVKNGYLDVPTRPGLGVELDEKAMADKIGHKWRNRETYDDDDGSVVDW
ncbi:MAG: galactonate dehydratase [Gemmataceae bacterium]|nr:galactonate dehydratase [Gemmataceae bacterium]